MVVQLVWSASVEYVPDAQDVHARSAVAEGVLAA
jgi:hypothetical protein